MPHMKALTAQIFAGTMRVTDDEFDATDGEARILIALGRAKVVTQKNPRSGPTIDITDLDSGDSFPKVIVEPERTRRAYRRRDMTAQGA